MRLSTSGGISAAISGSTVGLDCGGAKPTMPPDPYSKSLDIVALRQLLKGFKQVAGWKYVSVFLGHVEQVNAMSDRAAVVDTPCGTAT